MLEVLIVTLTEGQTLDLGVELEDIKIDGQTRLRLASLFGLATRGADGSVSTGNAAGFSAVVLNPGDFSVVIRALQTINAGRAQSMPKLLVGNNQQATLDSVLQQPFASVNASNTVSTTSFGGTQDAGTTVTIKPQIAEGDHLVLDYSVSLSSFLGSASQPTLPPPRQQNRIRSVATIPDGHTVVVGGIELENDSKTTAQVPLLGQIPIIGEAFKSRGKTTNRTRFYVFIRATVLRGRGFEDLRYLSNQNMAEAGIDDGWPTSTPRVIR
jgi:general secretion pathway protein D